MASAPRARGDGPDISAYTVLPLAVFTLGGRFVGPLGEVKELLPRYRGDNVFDASKFTARFPDFTVTSYREGMSEILGRATS